jgi:hypothetical protein
MLPRHTTVSLMARSVIVIRVAFGMWGMVNLYTPAVLISSPFIFMIG